MTVAISTCHGKVYLAKFPKENHREFIFKELSKACCQIITNDDLKLKEGSTRPEFPNFSFDANWSHSKDICILAYSFECGVGIDLEKHSPRRLSLADRFYSPEEVNYLCKIKNTEGEEKALKKFYTLWCRKEAFYKCYGGKFFEDCLKQSFLNNQIKNVFLEDLDPSIFQIEGGFSLCLATKKM